MSSVLRNTCPECCRFCRPPCLGAAVVVGRQWRERAASNFAPSLSPPNAAPRRWGRPSWAITAPPVVLRPLWRPDGLGPAGAPGLPRASDPRRPIRDRCRRYRSGAGTEGPAETRLRHRATPRAARSPRPTSGLHKQAALRPTVLIRSRLPWSGFCPFGSAGRGLGSAWKARARARSATQPGLAGLSR